MVGEWIPIHSEHLNCPGAAKPTSRRIRKPRFDAGVSNGRDEISRYENWRKQPGGFAMDVGTARRGISCRRAASQNGIATEGDTVAAPDSAKALFAKGEEVNRQEAEQSFGI